MTIIQERLSALRAAMRRAGVDAYIIPTDDFHGSEYVDEYFKCRKYISGFTGSAGTLVVTADEAGLWTDGRYFLQAERQLDGSGIALRKMGQPETPAIPDHIAAVLPDGGCLGYDGRTVSAAMADTLSEALAGKAVRVRDDIDLVGDIWTDRPPFPAHTVWALPETYTGTTRAEKLSMVRSALDEHGAERFLLSSLDDIAWLYGLRGGDIAYCPVFMAYTVVSRDEAVLYASPEAFPPEIVSALAADGVTLRPNLEVYEAVKALCPGSSVMLDTSSVNAALRSSVPEGVRVIDRPNPTRLAKAKKTPAEMENIRRAHIKDGVAVTKHLYWLRQQEAAGAFRRGELTELDVQAKLLAFRQEQPDFIEQSFAPIVGSGEHGAIVHYEATEETNIPVREDTFLLMDSGAHYLQGSTDITRTVPLGKVTQEQKLHYTAVLRGNLALAAARFRHGCSGANLDILARAPLWELGLDYNHGTGHGVGYLLNVHEGPQSIRLRGGADAPLEEGMLTSDEPGVYLAGQYGIRHENLMLCLEAERTEHGRFMRFETVTMVPFDRRAILPELLTPVERKTLNDYHARVFEALAPHLTENERAWLAGETAPI